MSIDNKDFPLYPTLPEAAQEEAQQLIDGFKERMKAVCEETLSDFYCHVSEYIESDHWSNFRNQIMDGMCNYNNRKIQGEYDFKRIRQAILTEHRADIISDLNQDMVAEIESLKTTIKYLEDHPRGHSNYGI